MDITTLPTYTEAKAHALANYEATRGLVIGGTYIIRGADGTAAKVEFRIEDGEVKLVGGHVIGAEAGFHIEDGGVRLVGGHPIG